MPIYSEPGSRSSALGMANRRKLRQVVAVAFGVDEAVVTDALSYNAIREWDSVAHFGLVAAIEHAFAVEFEPDDITAMVDVATIVGVLRGKGVEL